MTPDELALLKEEIELLEHAAHILRRSYEKCTAIGVKNTYSDDELESIEALTSRFARTADILVQRMFRLIDELDLSPNGTIRDRINRAEKKDLISDAHEFVEIRKLRNAIAHEYKADAPEKTYADVLQKTVSLLDSIGRVNRHVKKYGEH